MIKRIDTSSLVDRVYEYLLDQIVTGTIKYGDNISIKQIAAELNVSTMPVREAVKRMEFEQVVSIKPRSSCRVRKPSRKMIMEVYELREVLELYAVSKSLARVSPEALGRLHTIVERMRALREDPDAAGREKQAISLDHEFHSALCALAGNDFLNAYYRQLSLHVNMTLIHEKTYHKLEQHWPDVHAEILRCIEMEPTRAAEVLRRHFSNVTDLLAGAGNGQNDPGDDET
jgi:DNA-binding GntR family transcriptional regulator